MNAFDSHESGQLRLSVAGEQASLLPLPDALIPASSGAELASISLDDMRAGCYCPSDCNCKHAGAPWHRPNYCGCKAHVV